jgi:hypothetical protein
MKKLIFILSLLLNLISHAQTYKFYQTDNIHNQLRLNVKNGEVYQIQDDGQKFLVHEGSTSDFKNDDRYALYKTKNMWTYILLDKCTGKLWQCQYSVSGTENILSLEINSVPLSDSPTSKFTIQPLVSMFQYYLINEETGDMWKFQWSTKGSEYRWIEKHN